MIKVENIQTWGWEGAIRGMRNPMNSWEKSDSRFIVDGEFYDILGNSGPASPNEKDGDIVLGSNDIQLMKQLVAAGTEHRKFLRMIHVQMDITAPLYWFKEFDTYKVGTVANSCSTMHKIAEKEFTLDDFSHEHLLTLKDEDASNTYIAAVNGMTVRYTSEGFLKMMISVLDGYRRLYLDTKDKRYWWQLIQLLPSSYNQRRTVDFNYETAMTIIHQRTGHKLDEWKMFCLTLMELPYMEELYDA